MTAAHDTQALKKQARKLAFSMTHSAGQWMVPGWDGYKVAHLLETLASRLQEQEGQPSTFPARILTVLHELADRKGTATHGPAEDANGEPLQDDADAALAWIAARQEGQPALSERAMFEAWIRTGCGDLRTFGSGSDMHYSNSAVNQAWAGWHRRATLAAGSQAVQVPEATQDELLELAEALERRRCITISETVKTEQTRFEKNGKPTAFSAGFTLACEEIAHRIEHEEWVFQDPATPLQPLAGGEVLG